MCKAKKKKDERKTARGHERCASWAEDQGEKASQCGVDPAAEALSSAAISMQVPDRIRISSTSLGQISSN
jgi:hypothetical protein